MIPSLPLMMPAATQWILQPLQPPIQFHNSTFEIGSPRKLSPQNHGIHNLLAEFQGLSISGSGNLAHTALIALDNITSFVNITLESVDDYLLAWGSQSSS